MQMIKMMLAMVLSVMMGSAFAATTNDHPLGDRSIFSDRATKERLAADAKVCVAGKECASANTVAAAPAASAAPATPEQIYNQSCAMCHGSGLMGAPKLGDAAGWKDRVAKGMDTLHTHAIKGFNAMPAKGGCATCSDDDIKAAVDYIVGKSK